MMGSWSSLGRSFSGRWSSFSSNASRACIPAVAQHMRLPCERYLQQLRRHAPGKAWAEHAQNCCQHTHSLKGLARYMSLSKATTLQPCF